MNATLQSAATAHTEHTRLPPPIDRAHLARYTMGNVHLETEVLGLFATQAPEYLNLLQRSRSAKDWRDAAHTLKGSARAVGAWHVAQSAEDAEALHASSDKLARLAALARIADALDEACGYIGAMGIRAL